MNLFDDPKVHSGHAKKSSCDKSGICLDKHQTSRVVALLLVITCFVFVAGYFWGQHVAIDQLLNSVERDSFADQIHYSMSSLYDQKDDESTDADAAATDAAEDESEQGEQEIELAENNQKQEIQQDLSSQKSGKKYIAQLAGFGTEKHARSLIQRLDRRGIKVELRKRQSKTSRGKIVPWYQVVTQEYADQVALNRTIASIKQSEKLHDIHVIETV